MFAYVAARNSAIEAAHARLRSTLVQINAITELVDEAGAAQYVLPYNEPAPGRQSSLSPTPEGVRVSASRRSGGCRGMSDTNCAIRLVS